MINTILNNLGFIILIIGIILLTIYSTKASNNYYAKTYDYSQRKYYLYDDIYSYKISDVVKNMFVESEILQNYKNINKKVYI